MQSQTAAYREKIVDQSRALALTSSSKEKGLTTLQRADSKPKLVFGETTRKVAGRRSLKVRNMAGKAGETMAKLKSDPKPINAHPLPLDARATSARVELESLKHRDQY